jgi:hypothetical protein
MAYTSPFIGFAGSPKDYSSLEMARMRQADAENKSAKSRAQKELDDIYKMTSIDPKGYLPFRLPEIKEKFATGIEKILEAASSQDYNALQEAKNEILLTSGNFAAEKKDVDEVIKGTEGGKLFSTADFRRLYSGASIDDFKDMFDNGSIEIHEQTGRIIPRTSQNIIIDKEQVNLVSKYKNKPTTRFNSLGQQEFELDVDAAKNALYDQYMFQPAIQAKYNALNSNRISTEGKSPEQIQSDLANLYVQDGIRKALPNMTRNMPQDNNFSFQFGTGEQDARIGDGGGNQAINTTYIDPVSGETKVGTFTIARFQGVGDKKATMPISSTAYNVETGQPVTTSANEQFVFNGFGDINVLTQDFKVTARNGDVISYEKGAPIPDEYVAIAQKKGAVKRILGAQVKGESGTMVMPAEIFMQSAAFDEATADKAAITAAFNKAKAPYKDRSFSVISETVTKQPSSKTTQSKPAQQKTEPSKTKPASANTSAKPLSKEAQKRSSGNASLQKLIEQNKNQNQK